MTHTYRLGAQLQAMAIDTVDLNRFGTHRVPSPQPGITTLSRHRIINNRRTVLVVARDADARLVAAATAATPVDGGAIDSHITNFCSRTAHLDARHHAARALVEPPPRPERTRAAQPDRLYRHRRRRVLPHPRLDPRS